MRRVFGPVLPTCSLVAVVIGILVIAEPLTKMAVEGAFSLLGF